MSRLLSTSLLFSCRFAGHSTSVAARRSFASSQANCKGSQNSTPGWEGRSGDDHAVNRDGLDVQSDSAQEAMKSKQEGKEGSQAISEKDEGSHNKRAEEDHPEAPGPVIGMNDERGGVSRIVGPSSVSSLRLGRKDIEYGFAVAASLYGSAYWSIEGLRPWLPSHMEREDIILANSNHIIFCDSSATVSFHKGNRSIAHNFPSHVAHS
jgi:hypothetical protein